IYTLSLHDALPIFLQPACRLRLFRRHLTEEQLKKIAPQFSLYHSGGVSPASGDTGSPQGRNTRSTNRRFVRGVYFALKRRGLWGRAYSTLRTSSGFRRFLP